MKDRVVFLVDAILPCQLIIDQRLSKAYFGHEVTLRILGWGHGSSNGTFILVAFIWMGMGGKCDHVTGKVVVASYLGMKTLSWNV